MKHETSVAAQLPEQARPLRNHSLLHGIGMRALRICLPFVMGVVIAAVLLWIFGYPPVQVLTQLLKSMLTSRVTITDTVIQAIPILLIALGVCLCFQGKFINLGGEGQFYLGAIMASAVALALPTWPAWLLLPTVLLAGIVGGALWSGVAGVLRAYLDVHEVVVTLMLNSVAVFLTSYAVRVPLRDVGSPVEQTAAFVSAAHLPEFGDSRIHIGLVIALALVPVTYYFLRRTGAGYRIRFVGQNSEAARAAGVHVTSVLLSTFLIGGALAGLAGAIQVTGVTHRLLVGVSSGFGSTAILVALMAKRDPLAAGLVAFLFTALTVGGQAIQVRFGIPSDFMRVFLGILLLCMLAVDELQKRREGAL